MKQKFNIENPHQLMRDLKHYGKIDARSLRKVLEDTPPERFDLNVVKKYIEYVSLYPTKNGLQYEPEYWMYRANVSYDDAVKMVEDHKSNKSTSKEAFIRRHGEERGLEMFEKFQKTSAYPTTEEWFKEKYGDKWQEMMRRDFNKRSKRCVPYWIERGYTEDEARALVSEYQKTTSGVHRDYYKNRGYSEDEIDIIMSQIDIRKSYTTRNVKYLKEKYPDTWMDIYSKHLEKYRKRMEELDKWIEEGLIDDFKKYRMLVNSYTKESLIYYGDLIENLELRSRDFHLDHKYSIKMGFINDIDPKIIGSIVNLEIVPMRVNTSKSAKCSISKDTLLKNYEKFRSSNENQVNQKN